MFKEDQRLGISIENLVVDSNDKREPEMIDKGGIMIPKLDFTSIYIQREVVSSQNEVDSNEDGDESQGDEDGGESYDKENDEEEENSEIDTETKKKKFELQKAEFKKKMLVS